jgi:hypothetical protein
MSSSAHTPPCALKLIKVAAQVFAGVFAGVPVGLLALDPSDPPELCASARIKSTGRSLSVESVGQNKPLLLAPAVCMRSCDVSLGGVKRGM